MPISSIHSRSDQIGVIFRGTVTDVKAVALKGGHVPIGQIVTFTVDRVWKGDVPKLFTVYNLLQLESQTFQLGTRYLLHANRVGPLETELFGIEGNQQNRHTPPGCAPMVSLLVVDHHQATLRGQEGGEMLSFNGRHSPRALCD